MRPHDDQVFFRPSGCLIIQVLLYFEINMIEWKFLVTNDLNLFNQWGCYTRFSIILKVTSYKENKTIYKLCVQVSGLRYFLLCTSFSVSPSLIPAWYISLGTAEKAMYESLSAMALTFTVFIVKSSPLSMESSTWKENMRRVHYILILKTVCFITIGRTSDLEASLRFEPHLLP